MWHMSWADSLGDLVKNLSKQPPRRIDVIDTPHLMAADQPPSEGLLKRLAKEAVWNKVGFQKIEDRPKRARELEALSDFYIALRRVSIMQDQNARSLLYRRKCVGRVICSFAGWRSERS